MIHEEGALQIIDFGVAGMLHEKEDKRMTVVGTPHWMGPEALNPGREGYGIEVSSCRKWDLLQYALSSAELWIGGHLGLRLHLD